MRRSRCWIRNSEPKRRQRTAVRRRRTAASSQWTATRFTNKRQPVSDHLKPIVEALIFASPEPLMVKTLYKLLDGEPKEDVDAALAAVRADYERPGGLQLVEVAGGYQIVTRTELH